MTNKRSLWISSALAALLLLVGCGGGDKATDATAQSAPKMKALSLAAEPRANVVSLIKVSETRISRTVYDYVFKITVQNNGQALVNVSATLVSAGAGTTIMDGTVDVGSMPASSAITPADTITLRQDRTLVFDSSSLGWNVLSTPDPNSASVFIGPNGGTVTAPSGSIALNIPVGALAETKNITIASSDKPTLNSSLGNFAINLGPEGQTFAVPVTITIHYDPSIVPPGALEANLTLSYITPDGLTDVPTIVDTVHKTLTAVTTHFSTWVISATTTPMYQGPNGNLQASTWKSLNGCLKSPIAAQMSQLGALAQRLFNLAVGTDMQTWTGTGCVTEPYLANGYSKDTYAWDSGYTGGVKHTPIGLENHAGIDFRAQTPIAANAVLDGTVKAAGVDASIGKSTLIIESTVANKTYWIFYLHCSSHMGLTAGQSVVKGQQVCLTGSVGAAAAHLHFEVKQKGIDIDANGNERVKAMSGSHCPGSTFLAYNPIGGLFNTNASGCPLSKIAQLTVDPTVLVASQSVIPSQWDVVSDFSLSANPNGVWSYGFDGPGRAVTPMGATLANCSNLHINCRITNAGAIELPLVGVNNSGATISGASTVVIPNGMMVLHPGLTSGPTSPLGYGLRPVVTWTAPEAGNYIISGRFQILDKIPTGVRAIVQQDGVALIDELINGYGSTRGISLARTLNRGQVISFIVDAAGSHGNDSTGLIVSIEKQSISTFFDTFDSPPVNTTIWNVIDGFGGHSITNGELTFGQAASANTKNKKTFSGAKIVVEARLAGKGGGRDTNIALIDAATGSIIIAGDTNYFGWGLYGMGTAEYNLLGANESRGAPTGGVNLSSNGVTFSAFKNIRLTVAGNILTIERGDTSANITEKSQRTLGSSTQGKQFYLQIGTGGGIAYSPGTFDWVSVSTQ